MLCTPSSKEAQRGRESASSMPSDLFEEGARLVDEAVVLADAHPGRVHRQAAGDVGVLGSDDHPPEAALGRRALVEHQLELGGRSCSHFAAPSVAEDLQREPVRVARGHPGHLHDADAPRELRAEAA